MAFYKGLSPNIVGSALSWASYFARCAMSGFNYCLYSPLLTSYSFMKERLLGVRQVASLNAADHLVAATASGTVTTLLTHPIWLIKTRMCLWKDGEPVAYASFRGIFSFTVTCLFDSISTGAIRDVISTDGVVGFYKGLSMSLLSISHGAVQFVAYEELKRFAQAAPNEKLVFHNLDI